MGLTGRLFLADRQGMTRAIQVRFCANFGNRVTDVGFAPMSVTETGFAVPEKRTVGEPGRVRRRGGICIVASGDHRSARWRALASEAVRSHQKALGYRLWS